MPAVPSAARTRLIDTTDQHVAVGIADAALEKIEADILGTLRRERRDERGGANAAHRRDAVAVQSPSPHP